MSEDKLQQIKEENLKLEIAFEEFEKQIREILRKKNALIEKMIKGEDLKRAQELKQHIVEEFSKE